MIKISHIVSSDLLKMIDNREFYMCLANIASKDENYLNFYKEKVEQGKFVLLDNGAAESDQMTLDIMWSVIEKINPSEVILNDSLLDTEQTIEKSKEALQFYEEKGYKGQYLFVPQGKNMEQWIECYNKMDKTKISTIGVSKFITSGWKDSEGRKKCCKYLNEVGSKLDIHLLGCHENIKEVKEISESCENIRSNDTAIAYIYALANKSIEDGDRPKGEINFIKSDLNDNQKQILKSNIEKFDNLFNEE